MNSGQAGSRPAGQIRARVSIVLIFFAAFMLAPTLGGTNVAVGLAIGSVTGLMGIAYAYLYRDLVGGRWVIFAAALTIVLVVATVVWSVALPPPDGSSIG